MASRGRCPAFDARLKVLREGAIDLERGDVVSSQLTGRKIIRHYEQRLHCLIHIAVSSLEERLRNLGKS